MDVVAQLDLTPEQVAAAFWGLNSVEQVEFFAALERMAGINLCFQMAAVVDHMASTENREAQKGFQTMLHHAQDYVESATDIRVWDAQRAIARAVTP